MKIISRRDAIRAAAAVLAVAPIPAAATAALSMPPVAAKARDDAKLLALIASVPALLDAYDKAARISHDAWEKTNAEVGNRFRAYQDIQEEFAARGVTAPAAGATLTMFVEASLLSPAPAGLFFGQVGPT
jgi:hypothetical protein